MADVEVTGPELGIDAVVEVDPAVVDEPTGDDADAEALGLVDDCASEHPAAVTTMIGTPINRIVRRRIVQPYVSEVSVILEGIGTARLFGRCRSSSPSRRSGAGRSPGVIGDSAHRGVKGVSQAATS